MGLFLSKTAETSFRAHLTTIVSIGVITLSITASLFTAWVTTKNLYNVLIEDGLQVTESLADQSVLALLYTSGDNARDAVRITMTFPSVSRVKIITTEGFEIISEGGGNFDSDNWQWPESGVEIVEESVDKWIFMSPVYTGGEQGLSDDILLLQQESEEAELLGYVIVQKNKDKLREIQFATFSNNLLIGIIFSLILVYILRQRFQHLTEPLYELSTVMLEAQLDGTGSHPYSKLQGPKEVVQIARSYNKMMEVLAERDQQLREYNERLESEVALRTQELVYARDMAIEANHNKSQFLANITHELRTPLQAIIGFSDLIQESVPVDDMEVHDDLEGIQNNAQNLLGLINELLDFSKAESGRMELDINAEDLDGLFHRLIVSIKPLIEKNHNHLELNLELPKDRVLLDGRKLQQVLLNLLGNAAKFTENGTIALVSYHEDSKLYVEVKDSGIGISPEHQPVIFDAFKQVDGSHTRKFQGTGLGLAISKKFCDIMGGNISVTSTPGEGSTFIIAIPYEESKK